MKIMVGVLLMHRVVLLMEKFNALVMKDSKEMAKLVTLKKKILGNVLREVKFLI